jgi:hypothetical protein
MAQVDREIEAMGSIAQALEGLESDATARVLRWAAQRFGGGNGQALLSDPTATGGPAGGAGSGSGGAEAAAFEAFVDLFDEASPKTEHDRALVGGYWLQVVGSKPDFASQDVNSALKELGHGVGNITQAFDTLQGRKPALVRQVSKSGKTRQARKRYKLTTAGVSAVKKMLSGETDEQE